MTDLDPDRQMMARLRYLGAIDRLMGEPLYQAADRIEALSAENERLREALNEIKRLLSYANQDAVNEAIAQGNKNMAWHKARAALGETK